MGLHLKKFNEFNRVNEAYASKEDVAKIREQIKPILKEYGLKGTVSVKNYSKVVLSVKSDGKLINQYYEDKFGSYNYERNFRNFTEEEHEKYRLYKKRREEIYKIINILEDGLKLPTYRDNTDAMIDYFDVSYYTEVRIVN